MQNVFEHTKKIGCLIKTTLKKNSIHTIFQGGSPWAALIFKIVCLLWWSSIVSSFFWSDLFLKSFSPFLFLSFAKAFLFYFLISILLEFSKCLISQNIGCLIKTPLKNSTETIFQGGSPSATLIVNSMFVVGVLYCVQLFLTCFFSKSFSPLLCYSFCLLLSSILLASSPWFLWCFYGISLKFLWNFYAMSMVFLWYYVVFLKVCLW